MASHAPRREGQSAMVNIDHRSTREQIERWRALAAEARQVASHIADHGAKRVMLEIALGYMRMANQAEDRLDENRRL
jgi:hypothetical protein